MRAAFIILVIAVAAVDARAETEPPPEGATDPWRNRFSVMAGLIQWTLLGGANVAAQYKTGRVVLEYSHGQALHFNRAPFTLSDDERLADIDKRMIWTTGFGVGLGLLPNLHVLLEVKAHRLEVRGADRNQLLRYTTFTVGPGVFCELYLRKGLFLQPSLRWWPNVANTLDASQAALRRADGSVYVHEPHVNGTGGFFANVSVGWKF